MPGKRLRAQAVDATPSVYKAGFKVGVYDPREMVWAFFGAEERHVARWKAGQSLHEIGNRGNRGGNRDRPDVF